MNKKYLLFLSVFFHVFSAFSQTNDSTQLSIIESQFSDSIALINEQNEHLKASRDAYNEGLLLLENKNYIEAISHFSTAILVDSVFLEAYLSRAKCYESESPELAIADYLKIVELDSLDTSPLYLVAALQMNTDMNAAKQTYNSIISLSDTEYKAVSQLGVIAFLIKDYTKAEQLFSQSLVINTNAYTLNDRGSCYRKLEQFDEAIKDYLAAIALNSDLAFVYNNLASVYAKNGAIDKALSYYDLAISKDENYVVAYNNKASILLDKKEYEKAKILIDKALLINAKYAPAYNNSGVIKHQHKKYKEAVADFNKAIELDGNYAKAYLNRGISRQMTRDEDGACSDWNKAKELGIMMAKKYLANDCE
jgi:tetratricopeptide (TPR) repeat protein